MKQIEATIKPSQFSEVKEALMNLGIEEITVTEAKGFGRQAYTELYHGAEYSIDFLPKVKIQILVADEKAPQLVEAIAKNAYTEKACDATIFVTPVEEIIRIRGQAA
jgi:nitrogen regulatory protein P-II 1